MKLNKGYYLVTISNGLINSYDGVHDSPEGVSEASVLINRLGLNKQGYEHKMIYIPFNIPVKQIHAKNEAFAGSKNIISTLNDQLEIKTFTLEPIPDISVQVNEEAINTMAPLIKGR